MPPPFTAVTVIASPFGSRSCPTVPGVTSSERTASSPTLKLSLTAIGSPLMPVTVMVAVAVSKPPLPSVIVYWKLSLAVAPTAKPANAPFWSYVKAPLAAIVTCAPEARLMTPPMPPPFTAETVIASPSGSLSWPITAGVTSWFSNTFWSMLNASLTAIGSAFVPITVIDTLAVSDSAPRIAESVIV